MQRGLGIVTLSSIAIFALTGCISLTQYYARVPATTPIAVDPIGGYMSSGASGYHLFQFDNVLWRDRSSGEAFRDLAKHYYSTERLLPRPPRLPDNGTLI
jgi:hypothetical protein